MWSSIVPYLGGGFGVAVLWFVYKMHASAVGAERRRADEWYQAYKAERARADLKEQQMGILLGHIKDPAP